MNNPRASVMSQQPPGGRSSFAFNDESARGVDHGDYDALSRRHTNGVLRRDAHEMMPPPKATPFPSESFHRDDFSRGPAEEPAYGAKGSFDNIFGHPSRDMRSVESFSAPANSRAQAPPGGHSSFSLGWGGDNSVNHHMHARGVDRRLTRPYDVGAQDRRAMGSHPTTSRRAMGSAIRVATSCGRFHSRRSPAACARPHASCTLLAAPPRSASAEQEMRHAREPCGGCEERREPSHRRVAGTAPPLLPRSVRPVCAPPRHV